MAISSTDCSAPAVLKSGLEVSIMDNAITLEMTKAEAEPLNALLVECLRIRFLMENNNERTD
jgi:hypothetical protein